MKLYVVMTSEDRGNTWTACHYPLGGVVGSENLNEAKQQLEMEYTQTNNNRSIKEIFL